MASSSKINKKAIIEALLEAIEEDVELRHTLMGLLGFKEILDRITRLEEHFARLEEEFRKLGERFAQLEERIVKIEERIVRLEERHQKLEERFADLEERQQKLEERMIKVEERLARLEERIAGLQKTLITIGHRFGVLSETAFREAIAGIVEEFFGAKAYRWTAYDEKGVVYGRPSQVEVDVVIRDGRHVLIEVKSRASTSDILEIGRIAELYREKEGVEPELAIVTGYVDARARRLAEKLGVRIYSYFEEE